MESGVRRLVVGISGASGIIYGVRALECLRRIGIETHLVMTRAAKITLAHETELKKHSVPNTAIQASMRIAAVVNATSRVIAGEAAANG